MYRLFAILANIIWGITPAYFYFFKGISAANVIVMQVISTFVVLMFMRISSFSFLMLWKHVSTALLLLINWLGYFLAIQNDRGVEASLGYLIMPFILILCGRVFFHEKINKGQMVSLSIAFFCVVFLIWVNGQFPVYGVLLALSFALYTTMHRIRKTVDPLSSLFHESIIMFFLLMLFFLFQQGSVTLALESVLSLSPLGAIVVLPLALYLKAIKHINIITAGVYQFISPLLIMLVAVFIFNEVVNIKAIYAYFLISCTFVTIVLFSTPRVHG